MIDSKQSSKVPDALTTSPLPPWQHYTAPRMVIAGAGAVDHEELVALSEEYWGGLPTESRTTYPTNFDPASFLGSDKRTPGPDDLDTAHVSLAFSGTSWSSNDSFPVSERTDELCSCMP